jgi:hypothetical protein
MHLSLNMRGMTLVELTVTLAISGLVGILIMRHTQMTFSQESHLRYKAKVNESFTLFHNMISRQDKCTEMLKGKTTSADGIEVPDGLSINGTESIVLKQGIFDHFEIQSIKISDSVLSNNSFDVTVTYRPSSLDQFSSSPIVKKVTIVGVKEAATIESCGPVISEMNVVTKQYFCSKMGALANWDSVSGKCLLNNAFSCSDGNVPQYISATGTISCVPIAETVDFSKIFNFENHECPGKGYSFYQTIDGLITVGCPTPSEKILGVAVKLQ